MTYCIHYLLCEGLDELLGDGEDLLGVPADAAGLAVELAAVGVDESHVGEELLPVVHSIINQLIINNS